MNGQRKTHNEIQIKCANEKNLKRVFFGASFERKQISHFNYTIQFQLAKILSVLSKHCLRICLCYSCGRSAVHSKQMQIFFQMPDRSVYFIQCWPVFKSHLCLDFVSRLFSLCLYRRSSQSSILDVSPAHSTHHLMKFETKFCGDVQWHNCMCWCEHERISYNDLYMVNG